MRKNRGLQLMHIAAREIERLLAPGFVAQQCSPVGLDLKRSKRALEDPARCI